VQLHPSFDGVHREHPSAFFRFREVIPVVVRSVFTGFPWRTSERDGGQLFGPLEVQWSLPLGSHFVVPGLDKIAGFSCVHDHWPVPD
jgi:hypothetical protein